MRLAAAVLAALVAATPVQAQTVGTPAPQIATLDQDRLFTESRFGKALEAKAQAASQALAAENRRIEAQLSAEEQELTQKRASLGAAAFQPLAEAFDVKVEKLRADQTAKVTELQADRDKDRQAFFQAAVPILADLMAQAGAYAILNKQAVILSFDTIDLTDRAIAALDARLGDGSGPRQDQVQNQGEEQGQDQD